MIVIKKMHIRQKFIKLILIMFFLGLICSCKTKNAEQNYDRKLEIYLITDSEEILLYNNDSKVYTKKFIDGFKNAPRYINGLSIFGKKKNSKILTEGYYIVHFSDDKNNYYDYKIMFEDFVYNQNNGKAYKYNFCSDFYKYLSHKYLFQITIPDEKKDLFKEYWGF